MDIKNIIKSWKWRIVRAGSTQQEVAEKVGISRVHLNTCISGTASPSLEVFQKIETMIKELDDAT
jgi:DNA-binding XRE family transcriptional regulator